MGGKENLGSLAVCFGRTETLPALRSKLLDTFPKLLSSRSLDSDTPLRITIVNQAVFYTLQCLEAPGESSSKAIKACCTQEALMLIIEFFSTLLQFVEEAVRDIALPSSFPTAAASSDSRLTMAELIPAPVERILAALRVSVKWLCRPTPKIKPVDSKTAVEMGRALDVVLDHLQRVLDVVAKAQDTEDMAVQLREDIELRGFLALGGELTRIPCRARLQERS